MTNNINVKEFVDGIKNTFVFKGVKDHSDIPYSTDAIELYAIALKAEVSKVDIGRYLFSDNNDYPVSDNNDNTDEEKASCNDKQESVIFSCINEILYRSRKFGDSYPLIVNTNGSFYIKAKTGYSDAQILYIQLLLCSSLTCCKPLLQDLTTEFEKISASALKKFLPQHAKVVQLGKNSEIRGTVKDKINELAHRMNAEVCSKYIQDLRGSNEAGADIVAWIPFKDQNSNQLVFYCQCGCGVDYTKKCGEPSRYNHFLQLNGIKGQIIVFFPYSLIADNGKIYFLGQLTNDSLLFERKRILDFCDISECSKFATFDKVRYLVS